MSVLAVGGCWAAGSCCFGRMFWGRAPQDRDRVKLLGGDSGTEGTKYKAALSQVELSSRDRLGPASSSIFIESQLCARFHHKS